MEKFKIKDILKSFPFKTFCIIVIIGILAFLATFMSCGFSFGGTSCPESMIEVWIGSAIASITTAIFFIMIESDRTKLNQKLSNCNERRKTISKHLIVFLIISIFLASIFTPRCDFNFGEHECPTPEERIWFGAVLGVAITALFFWLVSKSNTSSLEKYAKLYVARTCVLNLKDIFGKRNGDGWILKTEKNRKYLLGIMVERYLNLFPEPDKTIRDIYNMVKNHDPISEDHDHSCPNCQRIVEKINEFTKLNANPIDQEIPDKKTKQ